METKYSRKRWEIQANPDSWVNELGKLCPLSDGGFGSRTEVQGRSGEVRCFLRSRRRAAVSAATKAQKRFSVRVTVAPQPDEPLRSDGAEAVRQAQEALEMKTKSRAIVRRYRAEPSPLVRDNNREWRTGRLDLVLGGDFDLL